MVFLKCPPHIKSGMGEHTDIKTEVAINSLTFLEHRYKNIVPTLGAFLDLSSLTLSPWATILLSRSDASAAWFPPDGAWVGGWHPGFQSCPVAVLYSLFNARRALTSASMSA